MTIQIIINGKSCPAEPGETVLTVAKREGVDIPAFCHDETLAPYGACRMCLVNVISGAKEGVTTACTLQAVDGLEVAADTPEILRLRRVLLELYLAQAPKSETIKALAARYGVKKTRFAKKVQKDDPLQSRCILCGLCVRVCRDIMGAGAINYIGRGQFTEINTPFYEENDACMGCGACAGVCPTHAIAFEDIARTRVMKSWSETRVPLKQCAGCGEYFAPEPFTAYAHKKINPAISGALQDLCPDCRRKETTRKAILLKAEGVVR